MIPSKLAGRTRIPIIQIEALVAAQLGPSRVPGNAQPAAFNRQIAMYLAHRVAGWSTGQIGRFYNGRDHSTVSYAVHRVEALREADPDIDVLIAALTHKLRTEQEERNNFEGCAAPRKPSAPVSCDVTLLDELADRIADRVFSRLAEKTDREAARLGAPPVENSAGLDSTHSERPKPEHSPASMPHVSC